MSNWKATLHSSASPSRSACEWHSNFVPILSSQLVTSSLFRIRERWKCVQEVGLAESKIKRERRTSCVPNFLDRKQFHFAIRTHSSTHTHTHQRQAGGKMYLDPGINRCRTWIKNNCYNYPQKWILSEWNYFEIEFNSPERWRLSLKILIDGNSSEVPLKLGYRFDFNLANERTSCRGAGVRRRVKQRASASKMGRRTL